MVIITAPSPAGARKVRAPRPPLGAGATLAVAPATAEPGLPGPRKSSGIVNHNNDNHK